MTLAPRPFYPSPQTQAVSISPSSPPLEPPTDGRVPFATGHDFEVLTHDALGEARRNEGNVYGYLLSLLADCRSLPGMRLEEQRGATYGQLAMIANSVGMNLDECEEWESLAECLPLSERHADHILNKLKRGAA